MDAPFVEQRLIEHGFSVAYRDRLVPLFDQKEQQRISFVSTQKVKCWALGLACLGLAGISLLLSGGRQDFLFGLTLFFLCAAIFAPWAYWRRSSERWSQSLAELIMPVICEHLGTMSYHAQPDRGFPVGKMEQLGVVPSHDKSDLSHWISGLYRDIPFELVQAELISRGTQGGNGGSRQSLRFKGLLICVQTVNPAPGQILIIKSAGPIGKGLGRLLGQMTGDNKQPVPIADAKFSRAYDVFATDPAAAQAYLNDATLSNLLAVSRAQDADFGPKLVTAGFVGSSFFLAIRRDRNFMQLGGPGQSLTDCADLVHAAFADIEMIHQTIDQLLQGASPKHPEN